MAEEADGVGGKGSDAARVDVQTLKQAFQGMSLRCLFQ
jgi:hypothetical protein